MKAVYKALQEKDIIDTLERGMKAVNMALQESDFWRMIRSK